ncbi:MAG: hypothetical protein LC778_16410 [Acidobacteria bacterium]|nr:hypothetical protein [Acidobacteriota bacterium]
MKLTFQTVLCGMFVFLSVAFVAAQEIENLPSRQPSEFVDARPQYCWRNGLTLENITQSTPANETIIVIARLGDRDSKPNLSKRRLQNVRTYWTQYLGEQIRRDRKTVILAEGEPTSGFGQIEFYVRGKLVELVKVSPNSDFNAADCYGGIDGELPCAEDWQKLFYPCRDRVEKQKQNRKVVPKKKRSRQ